MDEVNVYTGQESIRWVCRELGIRRGGEGMELSFRSQLLMSASSECV
jgi:hypothetical protein